MSIDVTRAGAYELSPQVFAILSALIEEKSGLHYGLLDRELLETKVSGRAEETGFESLLDYYYFLRYDPAGAEELSALIDALVVGETYFFREYAALKVVLDEFVTPWCAAGRRPRIWSAACATGEEPLSLAMMLEARGLLDKVDLVATDISLRALAKARSGEFGRRAVRALPDPHLAERFLSPTRDGWRIDPRLVQAVRFSRLNLCDPAQLREMGTFDVILCRNVLIYFQDETVRAVVERLAEHLAQDGVLLVGVSESLMRFGTTFIGEDRAGAFVYRKARR